MAHVVAEVNRPTLVIAPNKTLAAQLYHEFATLFPDNAVRYFVSYYDYYQPEAYVPSTDTYIEKDASINDEIDKMRHSATKALLERTDMLIVASVSCIYGLGSPTEYFENLVFLERGADRRPRRRSCASSSTSSTSATTSTSTAAPSASAATSSRSSPPTRRTARSASSSSATTSRRSPRSIRCAAKALRGFERVAIYPASHYVTSPPRLKTAIRGIRDELQRRLGRAARRRTSCSRRSGSSSARMYDLEMLDEMGFCHGIENYSRHLDGRNPGDPPATLISYFPDDYLLIIDESHVTVPQIGGMYRGDRSRKETLVEFGFRLPSALDNRPLNFAGVREPHRAGRLRLGDARAGTSSRRARASIVEQLIRPTGLVDPEVQRPSGARPGRRSARGDPRAHRGRASACW